MTDSSSITSAKAGVQKAWNFPFPFILQIAPEDRRSYLLDGISASYFGLFMGFMYPFVPVLLKRLNASPLEMGLCMSAPFIGLVVAFPLLRFFSKYKAIDLVTIPTLFSRFGIAFIGLFHSPGPVLVLYLFQQFVESCGLSAYTCVLRELYSRQSRSLAMGYVRSMVGFFMILGSLLGGYMLEHGQMNLVFFLSGLSGAVSSWNFRRVFQGRHSPDFSSEGVTWSEVARTNRISNGFFWLNVTVTFFGFGNLMLIGILPTVLVETYHISNAALGVLNAITNVVLVVAYMAIGRFASRHGAHRGLMLGMVAGVANPWLFLLAPGTLFLALPFAFTGVMNAGFDLCWFMLVLGFAPRAQISTFASVYTLLIGIRGLLATLVSNLALPYVGTTPFLILAGVCMFIGLVVGMVKRESWKETHHQDEVQTPNVTGMAEGFGV